MKNGVVNEITITSIQASFIAEGKYTFDVCWELDDGGSYSGDYIIVLYEDGKEKSKQTVQCTAACCSVTYEEMSFDCVYQITVGLPDSHGGVTSEPKGLIIDYFKNIAAVYDGSCFVITWDITSRRLSSGFCTISSDSGFNSIVQVTPKAYMLRINELYFKEGQTVAAALTAGDSSCSFTGPASETLTVYTAAPCITSAAIKPVETGTEVTVEFQSVHNKIEKAALSFSLDGAEMFVSDFVGLTFNDTYSIKVNVLKFQLPYELLPRCSVSCICGNKNAKTIISSPTSSMPLAQPEISVSDILEGKALMKILFPENVGVNGFELSDGNVVYGSEFSVAADKDASYTVRPRFDCGGVDRRGVASASVSNFVSGYYVNAGADGKISTVYRQSAYAETAVTKVWNEELFKTHQTETLESGVLKLTPSDNAYTLTVDTSKTLTCADYDGFIAKIKDSVTPYGFFALTDAIFRLGVYNAADAPYFLCAYNADDRTVDVRPQMRLSVQTSMYMLGTEKSKDSDGFVLTDTTRWNVTFSASDGFLEFDPFIGKIAAHMSNSTANSNTKVINACSIMDFMSPSVRQPYYRIIFPSSLPKPDDPETPYPSQNIGIMTADSYGDILSSCELIKKNPSQINQLNIPIMIFRGKSALSLELPVYVNGNLIYAPVGSNVGYVLQMCGCKNSAHIRLERENSEGKLCRVYFNGQSGVEQIVLAAGDRIEV